MTSGEFSGVDHDLLADYVGGALLGTPAEATVAGLVAADPAWRSAYKELTAALAQLEVGLRALAATDEPMPDDVVTRLDAALATAAPPTSGSRRADPSNAAPDDREETAGQRHLSAVPGMVVAEPDDVSTPGRRVGGGRRRWRPRAGVLAVAATVVVVAGAGVSQLGLLGGGAADKMTSYAREAAPAAAPGNGAVAPSNEWQAQRDNVASGGVSGTRVVASGTVYRRPTVAEQVQSVTPAAAMVEQNPPAPIRPFNSAAVPAALRRLNAPAALRACLDVISVTHQRLITTVELIDLADLEGTPALVVAFVDADGARWVWISGPACGDGGSGPDTLFATKVG